MSENNNVLNDVLLIAACYLILVIYWVSQIISDEKALNYYMFLVFHFVLYPRYLVKNYFIVEMTT